VLENGLDFKKEEEKHGFGLRQISLMGGFVMGEIF